MISDFSAAVFALTLLLVLAFTLWTMFSKKPRKLMNRLYMFLGWFYGLWALIMLLMWMTPSDDIATLQVLDSFSYLCIATSPLYLLIVIAFTRAVDKLPRWWPLLFVIPVTTVPVCLTNEIHHLQYRVFSIIRSQIVFGPYVAVTGIFSYCCIIVALAMLLRFAKGNHSQLYMVQSAMMGLGGACPLIVSLLATFSGLDFPITATPLSFAVLVLCNGIAIYQLNLLDITPIATQQVLDWISDCYLLLSGNGLVVGFNKPFHDVFGARHGIDQNRLLRECISKDDISQKTAIYNMITAVDACRESGSLISYEQSAMVERGGTVQKCYYVTDVSPLVLGGKDLGFVIIFKDVTQNRRTMQQLQDSKTRMMEQERFAFLGQMMGGLAHNLKTPIMSISGCVAASEALVDECLSSMNDPMVNEDDYREIYGEMRDWLSKIREATTYMSDIITAIKGQTVNVSTHSSSSFTVDELFNRTTLLMRHELLSSECTLSTECRAGSTLLQGDINSLVQVLANLISNAIHAQKQVGGGNITMGAERRENDVRIYVRDTGPGIPESVRNRLFREMATTKGTQGTGLGLYISNAVVHARYNGTMWCDDNPGGGAVFGMDIPVGIAPAEDDLMDRFPSVQPIEVMK